MTKAPQLLIIQTPRAANDQTKRKTKIPVPNNQILIRENGKEIKYTLNGVIIHKGEQSQNGHYVYNTFAAEEDRWIMIDDERVNTDNVENQNEDGTVFILTKEEPVKQSDGKNRNYQRGYIKQDNTYHPHSSNLNRGLKDTNQTTNQHANVEKTNTDQVKVKASIHNTNEVSSRRKDTRSENEQYKNTNIRRKQYERYTENSMCDDRSRNTQNTTKRSVYKQYESKDGQCRPGDIRSAQSTRGYNYTIEHQTRQNHRSGQSREVDSYSKDRFRDNYKGRDEVPNRQYDENENEWKQISAKKNNIVIHGLEEQSEQKDLTDVIELNKALGNHRFTKNNIVKIGRIGEKTDTKQRPLKIELENRITKINIFRNAKLLPSIEKFKNLSIQHDLTRKQYHQVRQMKDEARRIEEIDAESNMKYRVRGPPGRWEIVAIPKN